MVVHTVAYGILLTTKFGEIYTKYETLTEAIKDMFEDNYSYPKWIADCPSAEGDQLVLGFQIDVNKHTDFNVAQDMWIELMQSVPEELQALIPDASLTNVHVMSGKC